MKRWLFAILSIPLFATGADFLATMGSAREQIKWTLGYASTVTDGVLADTSLNQFIREGIVTVAPLVAGIKAEQSFVTSYRVNKYALDTATLTVVSVFWQKNDSIKPLHLVPIGQWGEQTHRTTSGKNRFLKRPSYYDWTDDNIYLFPSPTSPVADTIKIIAFQKVAGIAVAGTLDSLPQVYRLPVYKYALWRTAGALQHPLTNHYWQDYQQSLAGVNAALNTRGRVATDTQ